ncbi:auxin-responsive protein SAUR72-like [Macadamia integrifolia]|uniref:auxin-responsive protein SAUR72-like n=1 Tax=Macadamia integrifolia TaxID=60698 RepID=UPI001C5271B7|nr:auxin-responsive protein SAUR72-like [Macadamia integrifolia]
MEVVEKNRGRKGLIFKTWERCRSMGNRRNRNRSSLTPISKSRSWPRNDNSTDESSSSSKRSGKRRPLAPEGCFTVYVGAQRHRFVIKTEYANHPLFKMLLEEAELEYGYSSQGPLSLPCDVDLFYKVLSKMTERRPARLQLCQMVCFLSPSQSISDVSHEWFLNST